MDGYPKRNHVYVGDCRSVLKLFPDKCVDVSFTSPPYNRVRNDKYGEYDDTEEDFFGFLVCVTDEMLRVTKRDVIVNVQWNFYNKASVNRYIGHYADELKGIAVWTKNNPTPASSSSEGGYSVTNAFEFFFFLSKDDSRFRSTSPGVQNVVCSNVNVEKFDGHGAVMNKSVAEKFILDYTKRGDVILDPFFGMGTTGLVSAENDRDYIGIELSPKYAERAKERIESEMAQIRLF